MKKVIRELLVLVMLGVLSDSAFGQRKPDKQRPPKDPGKVVSPKPQPPPPPQNSNKPRPDKQKKP
jgi:hypothetical protein